MPNWPPLHSHLSLFFHLECPSLLLMPVACFPVALHYRFLILLLSAQFLSSHTNARAVIRLHDFVRVKYRSFSLFFLLYWLKTLIVTSVLFMVTVVTLEVVDYWLFSPLLIYLFIYLISLWHRTHSNLWLVESSKEASQSQVCIHANHKHRNRQIYVNTHIQCFSSVLQWLKRGGQTYFQCLMLKGVFTQI